MRASLSMASSGDQLKAAAAVAQSLAIIVGVGVTLNEIVLKDRAADRSRLELSISFVDEIRNERVVNAQAMLHALHDTAYRTPVDFADQPMRDGMRDKIDRRTRDLAHFYAKVHSCVIAEACDERVTLALICDDAERDRMALDEIKGRVGDRFFSDRHFAGLTALDARCDRRR